MQLLDAFKLFEDHGSKGRRLSPLTLRAYRGDVVAFVAWRRCGSGWRWPMVVRDAGGNQVGQHNPHRG